MTSNSSSSKALQLVDLSQYELKEPAYSYSAFQQRFNDVRCRAISIQAQVEQSLTDVLTFEHATVGIEPITERDMEKRVKMLVDQKMLASYSIPNGQLPTIGEYIAEKEAAEKTLADYQETGDYLQRMLDRLWTQKKRMVYHMMKERDTDWLTGLYNQKMALPLINAEVKRVNEAREAGEDVDSTLVYLDYDHFKRFNKFYGGVNTNEVLTKAGLTILSHLGPEDKGIRYGGDEIMLLFPGVNGFGDYSDGMDRIVELQQALRGVDLGEIDENMAEENLTFSAGIAPFIPNPHLDTRRQAIEWVKRADAMHQEAKQDRNMIRVEETKSSEDLEGKLLAFSK